MCLSSHYCEGINIIGAKTFLHPSIPSLHPLNLLFRQSQIVRHVYFYKKYRASYYSWGFNISIKYLSPDTVFFGFQPLHAFLSSLSRFIRRTKRFRPFDYACLSVGLLQSPAVDCIVHCSGPYSPLR